MEANRVQLVIRVSACASRVAINRIYSTPEKRDNMCPMPEVHPKKLLRNPATFSKSACSPLHPHQPREDEKIKRTFEILLVAERRQVRPLHVHRRRAQAVPECGGGDIPAGVSVVGAAVGDTIAFLQT
jgi:hypothetical protein